MEVRDPPASCLAEGVVLGIDEAGRGPVLGPMVYACAYWPESKDAILAKAGFQDSKALTEAKRQMLSDRARAHEDVGYVILPLMPDTIAAHMLRRVPYSLNAMSHDAAADLVREVQRRGVRVVSVFVDTVGDPVSYEAKLTRLFRHTVKFTVSKKADSLFPVVSAASILAKVCRDRMLARWTFTEPWLAARFPPPASAAAAAAARAAAALPSASSAAAAALAAADSDSDSDSDGGGADTAAAAGGGSAAKRRRVVDDSDEDGGGGGGVGAAARSPAVAGRAAFAKRVEAGTLKLHPCHAGSGYPGDAITKVWLRDTLEPVFGWPSVLRFSWATAKDLLAEEGVPVVWGDEDEAAEAAAAASSRFSKGKSASAGSAAAAKPRLTSFFAGSGSGGSAKGVRVEAQRAHFARARGIAAVVAL